VQEELTQLRAQNQDLEARLAAALLINEEQSVAAAVVKVTAADIETTPITHEDNVWPVNLEWFLGGLAKSMAVFASIRLTCYIKEKIMPTRSLINALLVLLAAILLTGCAGQQMRTKSSVVDYLYPKEKAANIQPSIPHLTLPASGKRCNCWTRSRRISRNTTS